VYLLCGMCVYNVDSGSDLNPQEHCVHTMYCENPEQLCSFSVLESEKSESVTGQSLFSGRHSNLEHVRFASTKFDHHFRIKF
jgi:hypothetical protein